MWACLCLSESTCVRSCTPSQYTCLPLDTPVGVVCLKLNLSLLLIIRCPSGLPCKCIPFLILITELPHTFIPDQITTEVYIEDACGYPGKGHECLDTSLVLWQWLPVLLQIQLNDPSFLSFWFKPMLWSFGVHLSPLGMLGQCVNDWRGEHQLHTLSKCHIAL